jgi:hypothetical protein
MKRLDYERRAHTVRTHSRNNADPVMVLAQVTRERYRLGQEQRSLVQRIKRIEARLSAIAATETKLFPKIRIDAPAAVAGAAPLPRPMPAYAGGMTLHY